MDFVLIWTMNSYNFIAICDVVLFLANKYKLTGEILGQGGFGIVYDGYRVSDKAKVAIKIVEKSRSISYGEVHIFWLIDWLIFEVIRGKNHEEN